MPRLQTAGGLWIGEDLALLAAARPTAVNLCWALRRMELVIAATEGEPVGRLLAEALAIHQEDIAANRRMAQLGVALLGERGAVLTHCNTGSLATGGYGTALGVIRAGYAAGLIERVYADETRPWLQGARLTAWELVRDGIPVTLLADARGGGVDAAGRDTLGNRRCGPDRRQRRCRQQDWHLSPGGGRPPPRRAIHGGGANLDGGCRHFQRSGHSHRTTRRRGTADAGGAIGRGGRSRSLESIVRRDAGGVGGCLGDGTGRSIGTGQGENGAVDGVRNAPSTAFRCDRQSVGG
ncbi:MAG: hypothetical protein MZU84_05500 [Sphingobacterium sp.]|nr:hypothetical protein [Sphingobacterium sp.]